MRTYAARAALLFANEKIRKYLPDSAWNRPEIDADLQEKS
jgi:hypothetical protein